MDPLYKLLLVKLLLFFLQVYTLEIVVLILEISDLFIKSDNSLIVGLSNISGIFKFTLNSFKILTDKLIAMQQEK